jgi:hypothetical protein
MHTALNLVWYPLFVVLGVAAALTGAMVLYSAARTRNPDFSSDGQKEPRRRWSSSLGALLVGLLAPTAFAMTLLPSIHPEYWLDSVASDGNSLVGSIESYSRKTGSPPTTLVDLAPTYIHRIPETGYPGSASWAYSRNGADWSLSLPIGSGLMLDFDEFRYSPSKAPDAGYRRIFRSGNWLYLDD